MKVMFVCTGNTCRSPMAEYIFRDECNKRGYVVDVISSGVSTIDGRPISQNSKLALDKLGIFGSENHKSQVFSGDLASTCDLILTMTRAHKLYVPISVPYNIKIFNNCTATKSSKYHAYVIVVITSGGIV